MRKLIILALVSMFIQGCATVNSHKFTDKKYPPKSPNTEIQIFTKDIDKPYIEIAAIIAFNE